MNFVNILSFDTGQRIGKKLLFLILQISGFLLFAQTETNLIQGRVTDINNEPLAGTTILIKGSAIGAETDVNGSYSIRASDDDVLVFSYVGMHTKEISLKKNEDELNLQLFSKVQELDEVLVKKRILKSQKELLADYPTNKNLIKTSSGILDKDRASHSMRMIDGSEILPIGSDFLISLRSHFPNMIIDRDTTPTPQVYFRRLGDSWPPAIFDVDGFIYTQAPTFISPSEIDRMAVILRNGAMARYGPAGAGGVVIINTKEKTRVDELGVRRVYDNSNLVDSLTQETNKTAKYVSKTFVFMNDFESAKSIDQAWRIYEEGIGKYSDSLSYFFETSNYFLRRWKNQERALAVLEFAKTKFANNVEMLRAMAFFFEEMGRRDLALQRYLEILKLRSSAAQSHRDMANAYNELGQYKKALLKYARYEKAVEALDSIPDDPQGSNLIMSTESSNIIMLRKNELEIGDELEDEVFNVAKTRILLEWNIDDIDLDIQVIDPDDLYVNWDNYEQHGYSSKQFFLDETLNGDWKLSIDYWHNNSLVPLVLKITTFFDYGLPIQKSEFRIFRLFNTQANLHLLTIDTIEKITRY